MMSQARQALTAGALMAFKDYVERLPPKLQDPQLGVAVFQQATLQVSAVGAYGICAHSLSKYGGGSCHSYTLPAR